MILLTGCDFMINVTLIMIICDEPLIHHLLSLLEQHYVTKLLTGQQYHSIYSYYPLSGNLLTYILPEKYVFSLLTGM